MSHDYIYGCDALLDDVDGCLGDDLDEEIGKIATDIVDTHYEIIGGSYLHGCDVLGESGALTDGSTVMSVQRALKDMGYDPGPLDGIFGPKTSAAITRMQGANGLTPTGQIDGAVIATLKEHGAVIAPPPPPPPLSPAAASAMTAPLVKPVGLLQRPVWQLALGGVGILAVTVGLIAAVARR